MQKDYELAIHRPIDHCSEPQAVGLDHVLARRHLIDLRKSVATSRA